MTKLSQYVTLLIEVWRNCSSFVRMENNRLTVLNFRVNLTSLTFWILRSHCIFCRLEGNSLFLDFQRLKRFKLLHLNKSIVIIRKSNMKSCEKIASYNVPIPLFLTQITMESRTHQSSKRSLSDVSLLCWALPIVIVMRKNTLKILKSDGYILSEKKSIEMDVKQPAAIELAKGESSGGGQLIGGGWGNSRGWGNSGRA